MINYIIKYFKTKKEDKVRKMYNNTKAYKVMDFEDFVLLYNKK